VNGVFVAFAIVLVLPLFIGTWRTSLAGLSLQGLLLARVAFPHGPHASLDDVAELVDLVFVRGIAIPAMLYATLLHRNAPRRNDVIAPNLLSWVLALALVLVAFRAADSLVPREGDGQTLVAVATAGLLLGLLVLATRTGTFSQMIGVLRIENAIALFELGDHHHSSLGIRLGQTAVLLAVVVLFRWYLEHLDDDDDAAPARERPSL
jgi:hydrogenase-4 component E